jgi:alpha-glucosidase
MPTLTSRLSTLVELIQPEAMAAAAVYRYRKAWADATWQLDETRRRGVSRMRAFFQNLKHPTKDWPTRWHTLGSVKVIQPGERGAVVHAEGGTVDIKFLASDLVHVRYHFDYAPEVPEPMDYGIDKPLAAWNVPEFEAIQEERAYCLVTTDMIVGVRLDNATLFIADGDGNLLRADIDVSWAPGGELQHRTAMASEEAIFGLGERATPGNRRGRSHRLWNQDPAGYEPEDDPINFNIPVYVGAVSGSNEEMQTYLVFYENPYDAAFDLGETVNNVSSHRFAGGELRYYLSAGPVPSLIERYTELTGRHDLPPLWMLGYQQSRWSYMSEARIRKLGDDFESHHVPCDALYMDIDYMRGFRCFTWDHDRFPALPKLASDLEAKGMKLVSMIDPGIKKDPDFDVYREGMEGGYFCRTPDGKVFHAPVWPGLSAFPDFTDPDVRAWWGTLYEDLVETGITGFWNDMNEPAAFATPTTSTLPDAVQHAMEGRGGDHREGHNLYGMQMVRATRAGLEQLQPEKRPVVITRSGWAGVQRYATSWTADNASTWASFRLTIPMMLGLGLSGIGFTGPDVGGFAGEADGELYTRWIQMAAFMPYFRAHTAKGSPDQEPWSYGEPYLSIVRRFIELRYELLPYLYTATWQMVTRGWPMVRPLWWKNLDEDLLAVEDAFLCGDDLLVAPVGRPGAESRKVLLPPGAWFDYWTNRTRRGGTSYEQVAPLETMPLFVREGTVLPMGEEGPNTANRKDKFLRLSVYPLTAPGTASSELYEDAGSGRGYREGVNRVSRFDLTQSEEALTLTWTRDGPYTPPYEHVALTFQGLRRVPQTVVVDGETYPVLQADPVRRTAVLGVPPFKSLVVTL